jgi:drug/metabolite transporter (DMT)-like permease
LISRLFSPQQDDQIGLAITLMLGGLVCLSLQDGLIKIISIETTLWQLQAYRALLNIALVYFIARQLMPGMSIKPKRPAIVAMRSMFQVGALTLFFGGAPFLTLAQMAGGLYTFPLFVGLFGWLLGEPVGPRRIVAIAAGFFGTLLVLRPEAGSFSAINLMPVGAGFCYALFVITTRRLCRDETPAALVLGANVGIASVGFIGLLLVPWLPVSQSTRDAFPFLLTSDAPWIPLVIIVIVSCSLLNTIGNLCLSKAYQSADSSFLAPIDYCYLLFATGWGIVLFSDYPTPLILLGLSLIAGAGIFVAWRERVLERQRSH